jgi:hypothetical protein
MSETRTPLPHPLCLSLCCKKLYMITDDRELALEDFDTAGYENFWCRHTMTETGPDGGWVRLEHCAPNRECYQADEQKTALGNRLLQG